MKSRADLILQFNRAIHYAAIIDYSNTLIECKGQKTSSFPLSAETLTDFASIGPLLVLGAFGKKLEPSSGRLEFVVGRFEKALVAIYQLRSVAVVLVAELTLDMDELQEVAGFLDKMDAFLPKRSLPESAIGG